MLADIHQKVNKNSNNQTGIQLCRACTHTDILHLMMAIPLKNTKDTVEIARSSEAAVRKQRVTNSYTSLGNIRTNDRVLSEAMATSTC